VKPLDALTEAEARPARFVLMDIDGTLTTGGKLPAEAYAALWRLKAAGFAVIPVTGRPAGWCDLIAREWPVDGVVGENGALAFWEDRSSRILRAAYHPQAARNNHPALERIRERSLQEIPGLRAAKDQFSRLFDLALDFAEEEPVLPLEAALRAKAIAEEEGAQAKISSIHVNIWMGTYDKLSMAELFLTRQLGWGGALEEVVFAGDSPNDEPMFARFPFTCAVANIRQYQGLIQYPPRFIAAQEGGEGFAEIAEALLRFHPPRSRRLF
jgi:HAD superfamily hydrolase (TIGR01484 family)